MRKHKYTKEIIESIVVDCFCWADVCRRLNIPTASGSQTHLARRAREWGIDTKHFKGKASNRGRVFGFKQSIDNYLSNAVSINSSKLRLRLIQAGIKEARCEICKLDTWLGQLIPLELDHIDSNHWNNKLENLMIVCPNCHAQETCRRRQVAL